MPNHCENDLFINGESIELKRFLYGLKYETREDGKTLFSLLDSYVPMPSELTNTVSPIRIVSAEEKEAIVEKYKKNRDHHHTGLPITKEEQHDYLIRFGADNWYDWANQNWGTKWQDYDTRFIEEPEAEPYCLALTFRTAWNPPVKGMIGIAALFPSLEFSLYSYERGMCFQRGFEFRSGILAIQWEAQYFGTRGG